MQADKRNSVEFHKKYIVIWKVVQFSERKGHQLIVV